MAALLRLGLCGLLLLCENVRQELLTAETAPLPGHRKSVGIRVKFWYHSLVSVQKCLTAADIGNDGSNIRATQPIRGV